MSFCIILLVDVFRLIENSNSIVKYSARFLKQIAFMRFSLWSVFSPYQFCFVFYFITNKSNLQLILLFIIFTNKISKTSINQGKKKIKYHF
jgi:hypothetical protein